MRHIRVGCGKVRRLRNPLLLLLSSLIIVILGASVGVTGAVQRTENLRGWEDSSPDLPIRVPLPGVNADLVHLSVGGIDRELNRIAAAGFVWVRHTFLWSEIEPEPGVYDFSRYDPLVEAFERHPTLKLIAVLHSSPEWARRAESSISIFAPPADMGDLGDFAFIFASRYRERIDYYQVWDEPNLYTGWGGLDPNPADYAAMLREVHPAIHAADPNATVIAAGLAPTVETGGRNLSDVLFLRGIYQYGAKDFFDAAAGKPYGFNSSPEDRTTSPDVLNFSRIILLREVMKQYGDGSKALWATHFGWNSLPPDWRGTPSIWGQVDGNTWESYIRAAYARVEREWAWAGGFILQHWNPVADNDDPIRGFAVRDRAANLIPMPRNITGGGVLAVGVYPASALTYEGNWQVSEFGADARIEPGEVPPSDGSAHVARFAFTGTRVSLIVRRDDTLGYLYVTVDGEPANALPRAPDGRAMLLLTSADRRPQTDVITIADGLDLRTHEVEIRQVQGYNNWSIAGVGVSIPPDVRPQNAMILIGGMLALAGLGGVFVAARGMRSRFRSLAEIASRFADLIIGVLLSIAAAVGLLLTLGDTLPNLFRRDAPTLAITILTAGLIYFSPALIVTLAALAILLIVIINRPIIGLMLVIFWSPLYLIPIQLYVRALPMVEVVLALTVLAMLLRAVFITRGSLRIQFRTADWGMIALVVMGIAAAFWSEQADPAFRQLRIVILEPALYYLLLRVAKLERDDLVKLVDTLILTGTAVALIGIVQFVTGTGLVIAEGGSRRLLSVYGSPNNAALFLGRCLPFALAMVLFAPDRMRKIAVGVLLGIIGVALLLTQSIGALLLGIPAALITVVSLWNRRWGIALAVLVVVGALALIPLSQFIPRLQGLFDSRSSTFARTQLWASTANLLRERPITGAGLDQFLYLYRSRYIFPEAWDEPDLSHPHNLILDHWVNFGIAGLGIFALLQAAFWRSAFAAWKDRGDTIVAALAAGAMGSMANFLAHGLVDNSYFLMDLAMVFVFTLAIVVRLRNVR
jgi:O-antigen ligase